MKNQLQKHQVMKRSKEQPWYLFDIVDPAPKFRPLGGKGKEKYKQTTCASEEGGSDGLSANAGRDKIPVPWTEDDYM